jgi:hypothetical protein
MDGLGAKQGAAVQHPFEAREVSAWIESSRAERATRILSDPRLRPTRVGSDDPRVRRQLSERFSAEAFDDLRQMAVATASVLWIDRETPLDEADRDALVNKDIALVAGACTLPFLLSVPQCETAPSFRRMASGRALMDVCSAFGRVEAFQCAVAVGSGFHLAEGLRVAAAAALAVLGPIEEVTAFGVREGMITASLAGQRALGTLAVATGAEGASFTVMGSGGLATITSALSAWQRKDGSMVEQASLPGDGDEPVITTILEAERPSTRGPRERRESQRRQRLRIAALCDTIRLSARTGHSESVPAMLRNFGVDSVEALSSAG